MQFKKWYCSRLLQLNMSSLDSLSRNIITHPDEIEDNQPRLEKKFSVKLDLINNGAVVTNRSGTTFQIQKGTELWVLIFQDSNGFNVEEFLQEDFESSLKDSLKIIRKSRQNDGQKTIQRILSGFGFFGTIATVLASSAVMIKSCSDNEAEERANHVDFGKWTQRRTLGTPDGEAATKELQANNTDAIFVITCGERNGDTKSISHEQFIYYQGEYPEPFPNDTSHSKFIGFEEIQPHPLIICRHSNTGSTWQYSLDQSTSTTQ